MCTRHGAWSCPAGQHRRPLNRFIRPDRAAKTACSCIEWRTRGKTVEGVPNLLQEPNDGRKAPENKRPEEEEANRFKPVHVSSPNRASVPDLRVPLRQEQSRPGNALPRREREILAQIVPSWLGSILQVVNQTRLVRDLWLPQGPDTAKTCAQRGCFSSVLYLRDRLASTAQNGRTFE